MVAFRSNGTIHDTVAGRNPAPVVDGLSHYNPIIYSVS
jgi:hypothetical protein